MTEVSKQFLAEVAAIVKARLADSPEEATSNAMETSPPVRRDINSEASYAIADVEIPGPEGSIHDPAMTKSAVVKTFSGYHQAAAVLATFDSDSLNPITPIIDSDEAESAIEDLKDESVMLPFSESRRHRWFLTPDRRIEVLRYLREQDLIEAALAANQPRSTEDDPIQRALDQWLNWWLTTTTTETESLSISERAGAATMMATVGLSLTELTTTYKVVGWLRDAGFDALPNLQVIATRIDALTLLEPFQHIAGKHFRGRKEELQKLRAHVGVIPPQSFVEHAKRVGKWVIDQAASVFSTQSSKALIIFGPGGVGKSTLVARFILEHVQAHEQDRFPFSYLDFDRPEVAADEPLTLLAEAVRQLGIEYPLVREACNRVRQKWLERLAVHSAKGRANPGELERMRTAAVSDFISIVHGLDAMNRPVVFVLDTFEGVQYHGQAAMDAILLMLQGLSRKLPNLRVIIAGRSEIPGWDLVPLSLGVFDEDSAIGYLSARGVQDADLAKKIYAQVGGSPLSLKLAADLTESDMPNGGFLDIETRDHFFRKLKADQIQAQLYRRVLEHIRGEHAENLRKLAHPGLVLRRVTPELIKDVLAGPCDVKIKTLDEAQRLFDALRREVSLVQPDPDGALRHRADLRRLMLELLQQEQPEKAKTIHAAAVAFYEAGRDTDLERAEEIYHRIWLDQDSPSVTRRWRSDVQRYLYNALPELEGTRKACLAAHLGVEVDDATLAAARLPDWERLVAERAEKFISLGQPDRVLQLIQMRSERTPTSQLFIVEARALTRHGQPGEAITLLEAGIDLALKHGERPSALERGLLLAEIVLANKDSRAAETTAARLDNLDIRQMQRMDRIELYAKRILLRRLAVETFEEKESGEIDDLLARATDNDLARRPDTALWAAAVPGTGQATRLARVLSVTGCPSASQSALRALALTVTTFDLLRSQQSAAEPGQLAKQLGVPVKGSLTEAWSEFLVKSSLGDAGKTLSRLLRENLSEVTPELMSGFEALLFDALLSPGNRESIPAQGTGSESSRIPAAERDDDGLKAVIDGIARAFPTMDELREFLAGRLDRSIDAISLGSAELGDAVANLVRTAHAEGWFSLLLARALEARPSDAVLASAAGGIGLSSLAGSQEVAEGLRNVVGDGTLGFSLQPESFRAKLGLLEAQVCRIEYDGNRSTGFLVGVDLLLTHDKVADGITRAVADKQNVAFRFDYKDDGAGRIVTEGTVFQLARDWLVTRSHEYPQVFFDRSEPLNAGFALLRLAGSPGAQPIGGERSESQAQLRRWIEVPDPVPLVNKGDVLFILHHPEAGPLRVSTGTVAASDEQTLYYDHRTAPGSTGAPCFSLNLELVALHLGYRANPEDGRAPAGAFGIRLDAILRDLHKQGLDKLVLNRFE